MHLKWMSVRNVASWDTWDGMYLLVPVTIQSNVFITCKLGKNVHVIEGIGLQRLSLNSEDRGWKD